MLAPPVPQPSLFKRLMSAVVAPAPRAKPFAEMGVSGTAVFGGYIQTREKSSKWTGQQRYVEIADMAVNASIIAASVHYFLNLIARPKWTLEPADKSAEAQAAAEFVEECIQDLTQPWSRVVRRAGTYRFYGFGVQEWTAKRRLDGRVGLASIEPRPQATIERWSVDLNGTIEGVWQRSPQTGEAFGIPRSKVLYLVDDTLSDSPEGIGMFRHCAEPWERLKQYYALEARAFERDLRGTPIGRVPYTLIREAVANNDITKEKAEEMIAAMEKFVKLQVKQSDTAITIDSIPYYSQAADGSKVASVPQWGLELLQGGAAGMAEVATAITRTQTEMARLLTTEHLMMGESSGNRSLGEDKSRNLYLVANAVLGDLVAGVELDVIPPLCDLNGIPEELRPRPKAEDVSFKSAEEVASTLQKMALAGAVLAPDDPVIEDVRSLLGVSPPAPVTPEMIGLPTGDPVEEDPAAEGDTPDLEDVVKDEDRSTRDESGRFTGSIGIAGGASTEPSGDTDMYHGTSSEVTASVLKEGLKPGKGGGADEWHFNETGEKVTAQIGDRAASVYLTTNKQRAIEYARMAADLRDGAPVVFTVRVPKLKRGYTRDENDPHNAYRVKGGIKAAWIKQYEEVAWKADAPIAYIVVIAFQEKLERTVKSISRYPSRREK